MRYFFGFISYFAVGAQRDFFLLVEKLSKLKQKFKNKTFFFPQKFICKIFGNIFFKKSSDFFRIFFRKSVQKILLYLKNEVGLFSEFFFLTKNNFFRTKFIFQNFQNFLCRKKCFDNFFLPRPRSNFFDFFTMKFYIKINRNIYIYIPIPDLSGNRTVLGRRYRSKFLFFPIKIFLSQPPHPFFNGRFKTGMGKIGKYKKWGAGRSKTMGGKNRIFFFLPESVFFYSIFFCSPDKP